MTPSGSLRVAWLISALLATACGGGEAPRSDGATPTSPSPTEPAPTAPPPTAPGCTPTISGLPASISAQSGQYPFNITIAGSCAWTARTDQGWADVAPGSGNGSAAPVLNVGENTRFDARTLTVTINNQSVRMVQDQPRCPYSVDPTSLEESGGGGSARVMLTTMAGCSWTVTASEAWITVLTPSGTGSATITVELAPNRSDVRHAYLTIAGIRVNITQRRSG